MYREAVEDGIAQTKEKYGFIYLIPCEVCGEIIKNRHYSRIRNYICSCCRSKVLKKEKMLLDHLEGIIDGSTTHTKRFEKAVANIKQQVVNFKSYEKAIELAKKRTEMYGSVPEAMVAIELLKNKHRIIPQQKIAKYRVDFALPDLKKIIEIDGEIYHRNIYKTDREAIIQLSLGFEWGIIHIPAELIAKDIRKLQRIINM